MFDQQSLNQLYAYANTLCGQQQDAYDLLHQCLENYLSKGIKAQNPSAYLRRMIRNRFIDQCRQQGLILSEQEHQGQALAIGTQCLEQLCIQQDELNKIWDILDARERELLYLWAWLEMNAREIAEELEVPRGTILSRIHRLRKKLQQSGLTWDNELFMINNEGNV